VKEKSIDSDIQSAFLKGNTKEQFLMFFADAQRTLAINANERIKIKFEVDTNPPDHATFETRYRLLPIPYEITMYDMPSLFAGKIHAVICRAWKSRVKGRDLYDYVFYLSRGAAVNLTHLNARLAQSGQLPEGTQITIDDCREMLRKRFASIDYAQAKQDVMPFLRDSRALDVWNPDFFSRITEGLQADEGSRLPPAHR
jgi:hypothetical protein